MKTKSEKNQRRANEMDDCASILAPPDWVKVVDFLQHNWAAVEEGEGEVRVWFIDDTSGVFDRLPFSSRSEAEQALRRNGFEPSALDSRLKSMAPQPPFGFSPHPNGKIYSSGKFWR